MDDDTEIWESVVGYRERYLVSNLGRVWSVRRVDGKGRGVGGKFLSVWTDQHGYPMVKLSASGRSKVEAVHRLVCRAFHGDPAPGQEVAHWDDNKGNARADNLRWATRGENLKDRTRNGIHHQAIKTHCPQGHEYTLVNTYRKKTDNARMCRQCLRDRNAETRARRKEMEEAA